VADSYSRAQLKETATLWWQMAHSVEMLEEIERKRAATADVGAIAPRAKQRTDPSMTLNKLRELGVHELDVLCLNPSCGHEITLTLPAAMRLRSMLTITAPTPNCRGFGRA
jgi:hypothetical protein